MSARTDREKISRARQVAEDLFKPRAQTARADVPPSFPAPLPAEQQPRRQPRIFAIPPQMTTSAPNVEAPTDQKQVRRRMAIRRETREIPASQLGRVRALTSYGMSQEQVAELYGVTVEEIERIIRRPDYPCKT